MKLAKKNATISENNGKAAHSSFYDLKVETNSGRIVGMDELKDKNVLIVNTASNCGYTGQYNELQTLYTQYKHNLVILGFPANDFKEQEKGSDSEIAEFCKLNFGVTFPLLKKSVVVKGEQQNQIFKWLSDATLNGWNNQEPTWNFSKYLIDKNGELVSYFDPAVSPLDESITKHLQ